MEKIKGKLLDVKEESVKDFNPEYYGLQMSCKEKFEKNFVRTSFQTLMRMFESFKGPCGIICGTEAQQKVEETIKDSEFFCLVRTVHKTSDFEEVSPEKDKEIEFYNVVFRFGKIWVMRTRQHCKCGCINGQVFYSEEFEKIPIYDHIKKFIE